MTCNELIQELEFLKINGYGDAEIIGMNEEFLRYVKEQKLFKTKHPFLDCINYNTEDEDEFYLEDIYISKMKNIINN